MSVLTTKARDALSKSKFALPGGRFPVEDKAHAANAKARATQGYNKGTLSKSQRDRVFAKADRVLGKK